MGTTMKIFMNNIDGYFGSTFRDRLPEDFDVQIQGIVHKTITNPIKRVTQTFSNKDVESILSAVTQSQVIIWDITGLDNYGDRSESPVDSEFESSLYKQVLQALASLQSDEKKTLVCISNVLTWSKTAVSEEDPDEPLTEDDFRRRKAHPNYRNQIFLEKLTLRLKSPHIKSYVLCFGLFYGEGENLLHFMFKKAWKGETIECIGGGSNVIPMIHVADAANILFQLISRPLEREEDEDRRYILGVDNSYPNAISSAKGSITMMDVVKSISSTLGSGKTASISKEDALLQLTQTEIDILTLNLKMEPLTALDFQFSWHAQGGIVENIHTVVHEFKEKRGLTPVKIIILGPPCSGKTFLAKRLCKYYEIPHLQISELINELSSSENSKEKDKVPEEMILEAVKKKLSSWECQNQGYILEGFPRLQSQANHLFADSKKGAEDVSDSSPNIMPEFVINIEATDEFIKERVLHLPQSEIIPGHTDEQGLLRRLQSYREQNKEDIKVMNYFEEQEEVLPITVNAEDPSDKTYEEVIKLIGKPHNYGPSPEELEAQRREEEEKAKIREAQLKSFREEQEKVERAERSKRENEWLARLAKLEEEERQVLEIQSAPFRTYLMDNVMPTLTAALIELCQLRPSDPIDYLAEYLFAHSDGV